MADFGIKSDIVTISQPAQEDPTSPETLTFSQLCNLLSPLSSTTNRPEVDRRCLAWDKPSSTFSMATLSATAVVSLPPPLTKRHHDSIYYSSILSGGTTWKQALNSARYC